jgi:hypothetical protein
MIVLWVGLFRLLKKKSQQIFKNESLLFFKPKINNSVILLVRLNHVIKYQWPRQKFLLWIKIESLRCEKHTVVNIIEIAKQINSNASALNINSIFHLKFKVCKLSAAYLHFFSIPYNLTVKSVNRVILQILSLIKVNDLFEILRIRCTYLFLIYVFLLVFHSQKSTVHYILRFYLFDKLFVWKQLYSLLDLMYLNWQCRLLSYLLLFTAGIDVHVAFKC